MTDGTEDLPLALVIAGPTASGKSALAVRLAEARKGTIINADALQLYRELSIISARPEAADLERAPHRLYGTLPAAEGCSAGRWRELALAEMEAARNAGRLPILVGGTGLYLKALEEGIAAVPPVPTEVRARGEARLEAGERDALRRELASGDPASHARLHPNDSQRLLRAWAVLEATGRPLSAWQASTAVPPAPWRFAWIVLLPPREALNQAIEQRFQSMIDAGALDEVKALLALDLPATSTAMKAVGVRELAAHLAGECSREAAIAAAQAATRRYAKRQTTWLRGQVIGRKRSLLLLEQQFSKSNSDDTFNKIPQYLLTLSP
ncbi:tRNA (adenosine(37)-N6)-dimethylallyltransferase MiaA [Aquibaculum sediminis]|uniref:tRNA (adenosine(37)-N6)-dimethylallyltransferase MiaA n=1 Tax=Aquibaculum sediminis TaxID=3231907 RepID=UPI00345326F2